MDLKPIEDALAEAQPAPWRLSTHGDMVMVPGPIREQPLVFRAADGNLAISYENAWLVAHAPAWMAELVAEVKRLRTSLAVAYGLSADGEREACEDYLAGHFTKPDGRLIWPDGSQQAFAETKQLMGLSA